MTVFKFADTKLAQHFGAAQRSVHPPVLVDIVSTGTGSVGQYPRALLQPSRELLVGHRTVADVTSLFMAPLLTDQDCGNASDRNGSTSESSYVGTSGGDGIGSSTNGSRGCGGTGNSRRSDDDEAFGCGIVKGFGRDTIEFRSFGSVLATGTKVKVATLGSGKVVGFRTEDLSYEILLDDPDEEGPNTVYVVPQNVKVVEE